MTEAICSALTVDRLQNLSLISRRKFTPPFEGKLKSLMRPVDSGAPGPK